VKKLIPIFILSIFLSSCTSVMHNLTEEPIGEDLSDTGPGSYLNDVHMATGIGVNIKKAEPELEKSHINVNVYNSIVLLTGEVPSIKLKKLAGETARKFNRVRIVHNELQVRNNTSLISRTNDSLIAKKIQLKLRLNEEVKGSDFKIITEDSIVYMMGIISRSESDKAVNLARETSGVRRVVRVFEYID
jgi:osmotically-inducible protein OsmY